MMDRLSTWNTNVAELPQAREQVKRHPRYSDAVQRLASNLLKEAEEDPSIESMLRDAGHNVAALCALYLDVSGEVTLARLKGLIAGFGLVSPGRARSLFGLMQHLGYLELASARTARPARYRVTASFLASYQRHTASVLDAISLIEPMIDAVLLNIADRNVFDAVIIEQGNAFIAGSGNPHPYNALYQAILHRRGGIQILHDLVARAPRFPPTEEIAFSSLRTAQQFKVSRIHVDRMMREAETRGLLTAHRGTISFTSLGREALDWLYASRLCLNLGCIARVIESHPDLRNVAAGTGARSAA